MQYQVRALPKGGHAPDEYEDAWAADPGRGCFALADGAAESSFAREWARLLVEGFIEVPGRRELTWPAWLSALQQRWAAEVDGRELPGYAEAKREQGAFAAFLGVTVEQLPEGPWLCVEAVGDSCLFQVRDDGLRKAFPIGRSAEFETSPRLVGSRSPHGEAEGTCHLEEVWDGRPGDRLWLMTDALAQWFLRQHEQGGKPWQTVEGVLADATDDAFAAWIDGLRSARELRNDDVTLLVVHL